MFAIYSCVKNGAFSPIKASISANVTFSFSGAYSSAYSSNRPVTVFCMPTGRDAAISLFSEHSSAKSADYLLGISDY